MHGLEAGRRHTEGTACKGEVQKDKGERERNKKKYLGMVGGAEEFVRGACVTR
jgi:hypothetical protein